MRYWIKSLPMIGLAVISLWAVCISSAGAANYNQDSSSRNTTRQKSLFTHTTLEQAWKTAVARQRPMLVLFSTEGCHYCTKMLAETYQQPKVQQMLLGHVETVKVNAREYPALIERLGIRGYPTTLLVSPKGKVLDAIEGFAAASTFIERIGPLLKTSNH